MIGGVIGNGQGSAWRQIKKAAEQAAQAVASATQPSDPALSTAPAPILASEPTIDAVASPLTYSAPAPSSGPRQITTVAATPSATLNDTLDDAGYYASPAASAVADPVATAQQESAAALSQAQIIAQTAYSIVARAGQDDRLSLIQNG